MKSIMKTKYLCAAFILIMVYILGYAAGLNITAIVTLPEVNSKVEDTVSNAGYGRSNVYDEYGFSVHDEVQEGIQKAFMESSDESD